MSKVKVGLFYRDGANYKCCFNVEIEKDFWDNFVKERIDPPEVDGFNYEDLFDRKLESQELWEIEEFGLTTNDIPMIQEYGFDSEFDHNYVSITNVEEIK
jgi:hypothetical protein